ncbi:type II toxin-antitoxin system RelE/ParE family toxin [Chloroflexales bacterium ZM16-3]|nr:type II toxin-antitoxin system RelE/ParE family toxin [Chloroflexales bacterium ZM16-3]
MASYQVSVTAAVRAEVRSLPGNFRQRMIRLFRDLEQQPRPHTSKAVDISALTGLELPGIDARRIRVEGWRIIYAISDEDERITVLAIRRRPPYQYEDLQQLLEELSG